MNETNLPIRSNEDEFLSYLGSCMSFYKMHLTPGEQGHVTSDIADILKEAMYSEERDNLVRALYPGYDVSLSRKL